MARLKITLAGTEYAPTDPEEYRLCLQIGRENAGKMNELFEQHFGLSPRERYMGSFPYPDQATGACRVAHVLSMAISGTRDLIVASLNEAIAQAGIADVIVSSEDGGQPPYTATLEITVMGPSITNNLIAEQRLAAVLQQLEDML